MNLEQLIQAWKSDRNIMGCVTCWKEIPAKPAQHVPWPAFLSDDLISMMKKRGVTAPYTHQAKAMELVADGRDVVVVTPTASGKSLCYHLPVLDAVIRDENTRALYLFPTKALAADQAQALYRMIEAMGRDIKAYTYDGDTPGSARRAVRQAGQIVVTNPDMLHSGILPHHAKWVKLFENLQYVVIDEIHTYRGIFGSHLSNVIRRLKRICQFYGSDPRFICCSATIANPRELAEQLTGRAMSVVDESGAPQGERHVVFYNPPVVNRQLGIRKSAVIQSRILASVLVANRIQTIVFARSRLVVEVLVTYLKQIVAGRLGNSDMVRGYRGGYTPLQRRSIERGLRDGSVVGVVSTNALELGVDIGGLQACILCGYPGTIAGTWQQAGRAGRRNDVSLMMLVATSSPMDQFIVRHPEYFFGQSPETALINPNNLYIFMSHLKCAAFELPFEEGELFGVETTDEALEYLQEEGVLRLVEGRWYWSSETFPASSVSLRSATDENVIIMDVTTADTRAIGEMDHFAARMLLHDEAIYLHEGALYQVEKLDLQSHKAFVKTADVDYYTDADLSVDLKVLDVFDQRKVDVTTRAYGEVLVTSIVTMFKKIKFDTHENLGWGPVNLPEMTMHTGAMWVAWPVGGVQGLRESQAQAALHAATHLIAHVAPLYLMCDPKDISVSFHVREPFTGAPTLFVYDAISGGMGLSEKLYHMFDEVLERALEALKECPCEDGCPSCIGPSEEDGVKILARELLEGMLIDHA
ncbi:MAG: DEAD/DEAH box helicase [Christensenellales bacterium]|jgi:DEAD/DEAH box helicase domain-containing protein